MYLEYNHFLKCLLLPPQFKSLHFSPNWFPYSYSCSPLVCSKCNSQSDPVSDKSDRLSSPQWLPSSRRMDIKVLTKVYKDGQQLVFCYSLILSPTTCHSNTLCHYHSLGSSISSISQALGVFPFPDLTLCETLFLWIATLYYFRTLTTLFKVTFFSLSHVSPSKILHNQLIFNIYCFVQSVLFGCKVHEDKARSVSSMNELQSSW